MVLPAPLPPPRRDPRPVSSGGNVKVRGPGHSPPKLHTAPRSPGTWLGMCTMGRQEADSLQGYFRGFSSKSVLPENSSVPRKNLSSRVKVCQPASQQCVHLSLPKGTHTSEQSPRGVEEPLPCHCWLCLPKQAEAMENRGTQPEGPGFSPVITGISPPLFFSA